MGSFGERLRREREKRGVSLEEIAGSTKIGTRSLRALEDDAFDSLPGGIFNKGFVRAYARTLGLDEGQWLADFNAAHAEYLAAHGPPPIQPAAEEESEERFSLWPAIAVLAAIGLVGAGWFVWRTQRTPDGDAATAQVANAPTTETQSSAPVTSEQSQQTATATSASAVTRPAVETPPAAVPRSPEKPKVSGVSSAAELSASRTRTPAPIRLELFAREESWISVLADGKSLGQGVLAAQKHKSIAAQKEVRVKLGNVAGVEVSFNGQPINVDGQPKQVKELTFTVDGLQQ